MFIRVVVVGAASLTVLAGCANQKPVMYGDHGNGVSQAIKVCEQRAHAHGLSYRKGGHMARRSAERGAVGAAGGAAAGAIYGNAGRGAAAGAAGGVVTGLTQALFSSHKPAPIYRRYVNRCLRDKGYKPLGWR
ncbi:hypothetical protein HKX42_09725 [Salinisphaera sp. USBA-960]|nr:hypothetical protein [Salifodinibacter halophilus]NNC27152.1 hypothetical protein [Salifodinibacter halophilus]